MKNKTYTISGLTEWEMSTIEFALMTVRQIWEKSDKKNGGEHAPGIDLINILLAEKVRPGLAKVFSEKTS